ncbi:hypothetical protein TVAG_401140 [Trichomonas vaginalis G3]|uniref:Uncharacterized protein n=1 Tax=Trichomonas vaginalis (strain ATCC PRA-98 / G3) TaxID=412133 RepID=A2E3M2_TRIV3|nr:hypothetical protein TVAGG3_0647160 [Trichomonas vaginalis G3]EAY12788.1 hypothetical protein TVAG_401140 [Trichomonas vaginalis G3]KAI5505589.1 hypothetical protein TVAGG3_0647160 [Trichomonas vaginalis G3]|eukprot:XP_001325011.1 hypothetical protein [Trichomonas vaginalis G3]
MSSQASVQSSTQEQSQQSNNEARPSFRSYDDVVIEDYPDKESSDSQITYTEQDVDFADDTDFEYMFSSTQVPFVGSFVENFMYNEILV